MGFIVAAAHCLDGPNKGSSRVVFCQENLLAGTALGDGARVETGETLERARDVTIARSVNCDSIVDFGINPAVVYVPSADDAAAEAFNGHRERAGFLMAARIRGGAGHARHADGKLARWWRAQDGHHSRTTGAGGRRHYVIEAHPVIIVTAQCNVGRAVYQDTRRFAFAGRTGVVDILDIPDVQGVCEHFHLIDQAIEVLPRRCQWSVILEATGSNP